MNTLPGFIPQKGARQLPGALSYYYLIGYGGIGLYILVDGGYKLVFGTTTQNKHLISHLYEGWSKFAKPLIF